MVELKLGEVICDECDGNKSNLVDNFYYFKCNKCHGTGKLDWIENIVGKRTSNPIMNGVTWLPPSALEPKNAQVGQAYIDSNSNECYIYDGIVWVHTVSMNTLL